MLHAKLRLFGVDVLQIDISTDDDDDGEHVDSLDSQPAGFVSPKPEREGSADYFV